MPQLARSFVCLFLPLAVILGGITAFLYVQETKSQRTAMNIKVTVRLNTQKEVITSYIQAIGTDVLTVSKQNELLMMLDNSDPRYLESLAREFLWFCKIKKIYDQVRFLDENGMEILRVNYNNGAPAIVPVQDLQPKGERYYFKDTYQLAENEVFVSPFDLNIEHGRLEMPLKPMIRFGTPVFDSQGKKRGIVLLNYLGDHLLHILDAISKRGYNGNVLLLNSEGYYLHSLSADDEWGFMYPDRKDRTFARAHPEAWHKISRIEAGQVSNAEGIYTFTTIRPFTEAQVSSTGSGEPFTPSQRLLQGSECAWKLVAYIPGASLINENRAIFKRTLMIYSVILILLAIGGGYVTYAGAKRRQAEDEVRNHRDYLQKLVGQRTAELTHLNIQLQEDIDERMKIERELRESEEKYRSMMEAMNDATYICSNDFRIVYMNSAMRERIGYNAVGERCSKVIHGLDEQCPWCVHQRVMDGEHVRNEIVSPKDKRTYQVSNSPIFHLDGSISKLTIFRDNTDVRKIEAQLQQAQKLESVGRLAGGVAHDYNNALSVIIGFTELALDDAAPDSQMKANLEEILKAAHNATDITRQLLTFARKQNVEPKLLDLNTSVGNMLKMLRRLIGEDIDLVWVPESDLWPIEIDPSQVNQILANLCVNSRDAIKGVGKITIQTKNIRFDESLCKAYIDSRPGDFVKLAVSDNGCGMDKRVQEKIFEPFFTTKNVDKGTGLGLSTVYGIVKQNNGFINVYSEPGHGTTVSIHLPRHQGKIEEVSEADEKDIPAGNGETILLVEDDLSFLKLAQKILHGLGYNLLTANSPAEALALAEKYTGKIHLLVTDVIMPEMNGSELSERIVSICPGIKYMYISGYTADIIMPHLAAHEHVHLLQKPFSQKDFATTVRNALDG